MRGADHWPNLTEPKVASHPGDLRVVGRSDERDRAMISQPVFDREDQAEHGRRLDQVNGEGLAHRLNQVGVASLGGERVEASESPRSVAPSWTGLRDGGANCPRA